MQVHPKKCEWFKSEAEYLGYVISTEGVKPQQKKIDKILAIKPPTNKSQVRKFLGMVNYYRSMWPGRSTMITPLTAISGKNSIFRWTATEQKAFDNIKTKIAEDTILRYPDFSKPFVLYTDSSDFSLLSPEKKTSS